MKAYGGAHHWAKELTALGHNMRLLHAKIVRPFVSGHKTARAEDRAFKSWREFCAWLGLVPKQTGSGCKIRLGGVSKRGDTYVRVLLIHGARSVLAHAKEPGPWLAKIKTRRPANVLIVVQATKMDRTIWTVTAKEQSFQKGFKSVRPNAATAAAA